jgi:HlyD family secretion protein
MRRWLLRIALVSIVAATVAGLVYAYAPRPLLVDVARVSVGRLVVSRDAEGKIRVRERYLVHAPIAGISSRIEVHPGDVVAVAATLARIQPMPAPLLDTQSRGTAEARLRAAEDARTQAEATLERARAELDFAKSELERTRSLAAGGTVPVRQLEQAQFEVRSGEAMLRSAQFALQVAGHEVDFARAAYGELQPGRADRRAFAVQSPIEGHVLRVERESEGPVVAGTPLLELGDLSALEVVADVLTRDAEQLRRGVPVLIGHGEEGKEFAGHIRRVEPAAFTRVSPLGVEEQRVNVLVDLAHPEEVKLGDGFAVDVRFVISDDPRVLHVPASALFRVSEGWGAFAVQNGRAALRVVKPGKRNPLQVEVLSGLSEGDTVILHPGELVRDAVRVETR